VFDEEEDGKALESCVKDIGDELNEKFHEMVKAAEILHGAVELMTNAAANVRTHRYDDSTHTSAMRKLETITTVAENQARQSELRSSRDPFTPMGPTKTSYKARPSDALRVYAARHVSLPPIASGSAGGLSASVSVPSSILRKSSNGGVVAAQS